MPGPFNKSKFQPYMPKSAADVFLGMEVRNVVINLAGTVTSVRQLVSGQIQFLVEPKGDGKTVPDGFYMDWHLMEIIGEGVQDRVTKPTADVKITLGEEVKHKISGFRGIATESFTYINGCMSFWVVPTEEYTKQFKDGKPMGGAIIESGMLEVVGPIPDNLAERAKKTADPATPKTATGGPTVRVRAGSIV
jgi:hypothetical protein